MPFRPGRRATRAQQAGAGKRGHLRGPGRSPGVNQRSLSRRLAGAQNAQIWAASVLAGIGPAAAQNGGALRWPPRAPPRFVISGRTIVIAEARVSGDWQTSVLWFKSFGGVPPGVGGDVEPARLPPAASRCAKEYIAARRHRNGEACAGGGSAGGRFTSRARDPPAHAHGSRGAARTAP